MKAIGLKWFSDETINWLSSFPKWYEAIIRKVTKMKEGKSNHKIVSNNARAI